MGKGIRKDRLHPKRSNIRTVQSTVLAFVILLGLVSNVSPQRTYQRACDCEYMVNGKCAYTLLLPAGSNNDATCPGAGAEPVDSYMRNMTTRVNSLFDMVMNQSLLLLRVQDSIIDLQRNSQQQQQPPMNDSGWGAMLVLLNATIQSGARELDQLKTTTQMLTGSLTNLTNLFQIQVTELSNLTLALNTTKETLEKRADDDDAKMSQLSEEVKMLRQASCYRRAVLFSGPDRLNGTSITFSSIYNNDTENYGVEHLGLNYLGSPGAWCPQERSQQEWVQFDMGREVLVFGIATRGRAEISQYIATYNIQYVPTNSSATTSDVPDFVYFKDVVGANQIFPGNTDSSTVQLNMLWRPLFTRYVRILPLTGANNGNVCTRADVIGCVDQA